MHHVRWFRATPRVAAERLLRLRRPWLVASRMAWLWLADG